MTADLQVLVVAYGADDLLDQCLAKLADQLPVMVVDNASRPETRNICAERGATYVDAGSNVGFAGGVNHGLRALADTDVMLLNPDAELGADEVRALHDRLHGVGNERVAAVAPAQRHPVTGERQRVGWSFPSPRNQWLIAVGLGRLLRRTDFLIGSALLIKSGALSDVGPFDERYFLYCEETDWQRRAHERGWRVELVPEVTAHHIGAGTSSNSELREAYFHAGNELYVRKWHGRNGWLLYRAAWMTGDAIRILTGGERSRAARRRLAIHREGAVRHRNRLLAA